MHLKAEQYERIVAQLRSERRHERRGNPRVGLRAQVTLVPCRTGVRACTHTVWIRDLSATSVGFIFQEPLEPGTYVVMMLPRTDGPTLDLLFVVRRCSQLNNGQFSIGAGFERLITDEDLNHST
jgi:PilZ domain